MKKYQKITLCGAILPLLLAPIASNRALAQTTAPSAANAKVELINAGELRLDGKITAILGTGSWQIEALSWTSPRGITTNFDEPKNKGVKVGADASIHPRGEAEKVALKDVKLGTRVAIIGKNGPDGKLIAREVILLEGYGSRKTVGQVSSNPETWALVSQSRAARELGQLPQALTLIDRAVTIARGLNDANGEGLATQDKALIHAELEQYDQAAPAFARVAQIGRTQGNPLFTALGLNGGASLLQRAGQSTKAIEMLKEAVTASAGTEAALQISVLSNLAATYIGAGQTKEAADVLGRIHPLEDAQGKDSDAGETLLSIAMIRASDDPAAARETLKQVAPRIERARDDKAKANLLGYNALVRWRLNDKEGAGADFARAVQLAQGAGAEELAKKWRELPAKLAAAGNDFTSFWNVVTGQKAPTTMPAPPDTTPPVPAETPADAPPEAG